MKLSDFRVEGKTPPEPEPLAEVLAPDRNLDILAFDQALAQTGWAYMRWGVVYRTGIIETLPGEAKGFEDSFRRGMTLYRVAQALIETWPQIDLIVHEMPVAVRGPMSNNREAGIVATTALRCAADQGGPKVVMLNAQHVRKVLCGDAKATKSEVKQAVLKVFPSLLFPESGLRLNAHIYDAIALAIVAEKEHADG